MKHGGKCIAHARGSCIFRFVKRGRGSYFCMCIKCFEAQKKFNKLEIYIHILKIAFIDSTDL